MTPMSDGDRTHYATLGVTDATVWSNLHYGRPAWTMTMDLARVHRFFCILRCSTANLAGGSRTRTVWDRYFYLQSIMRGSLDATAVVRCCRIRRATDNKKRTSGRFSSRTQGSRAGDKDLFRLRPEDRWPVSILSPVDPMQF